MARFSRENKSERLFRFSPTYLFHHINFSYLFNRNMFPPNIIEAAFNQVRSIDASQSYYLRLETFIRFNASQLRDTAAAHWKFNCHVHDFEGREIRCEVTGSESFDRNIRLDAFLLHIECDT